jgi:hypothetical protein
MFWFFFALVLIIGSVGIARRVLRPAGLRRSAPVRDARG